MDDNEFHRRAFSEPHSDDPDLHRAARSDTARMKLLEELSELEDHIRSTVSAVAVPSDLADRLKQQIHTPPGTGKSSLLRYFAAATTGLAVVVVLLIAAPYNAPNRHDQALHDNLVAHLHHEASAYNGDTSTPWSDASGVLLAAGIALPGRSRAAQDDRLQAADIKFANHCELGNSGRGAHIVLQGEHGPVSVILTRGNPVERPIDIEDERFHGRITPTEDGNIAVAGEKGEELSDYESLVADSVAWSI